MRQPPLDDFEIQVRDLEESEENNPLELAKSALTVVIAAITGGHLLPIPEMAAAGHLLEEHFSTRRRVRRVREVTYACGNQIIAIKNTIAKDREDLQRQIDERLKSSEFAEAFATAAEEATRTTNAAKLNRLAAVLANSCDPTLSSSTDDDLTSFVHDISRLSEGDVKTLNNLFISSNSFYRRNEKTSGPKSEFSEFINDMAREQSLGSDFYSHCFRLVGFGLATQLAWNSPEGGPSFRVSDRGRHLLNLLRSHAETTQLKS